MAAAARACEISLSTAKRILGPKTTAESGNLPFSGNQQPAANVPTPAWFSDQPQPPPRREFDRNYHGHTFRSFNAPLTFDGFDLQRVRRAISLHRIGNFLESSTLAMVCLGFPPVMTAVGQRMAPALALPRMIRSGNRGLSRVLGAEIEKQICPREGLYPSDYFPSSLFGVTQFDIAMMGFSVWQHAFGAPDPETGIMPLYTRRWPTWAVQYYRYRRTYVAITDSGPVDILNDGKFTLIGDSEEPHFMGAVLAISEEALDGISTRNARGHYIDAYGNPKWIGIMPEGQGPNSKEGDAMMDALATLRAPDGWGIIPYGSDVKLEGLDAGKSTVLKDALDSNWKSVTSVLLGSDGTTSRGAGVYTSPIFEHVARYVVDRDIHAIVRGANQGHVRTYLEHNYALSIAEASGWVDPVLDIPLPDPDADARIKSYADRLVRFHEIVEKERQAGFLVTQERANQIAASLEIDPPTLLPGGHLSLSSDTIEKTTRVKEVRAYAGREPLGDERDEMTVAELDALSKSKASAPSEEPQSEPGSKAPEGSAPPQSADSPSQETTEPKKPSTSDPFEGAAKDDDSGED